MVKEMATRFEQDLLEHLRAPVEIEPRTPALVPDL
jgi:hypothetical protein